MGKNHISVACLFAAVLTTDFFFGVPCYHVNLCVGQISGDFNNTYSSIGSQNQNYQRDNLAASAYSSQGAFIVEANTIWTPHYITYNSADMLLDKGEDNFLLGWLHINLTIGDPLHVMVIQPFVPVNHASYVPGEIRSTRFRPELKETVNNRSMPKEHLSPCYFVSDPSPTLSVAFVLKDTKGVSSMKLNYRMDFPECSMVHQTSHLEFRFYGNRYSLGNRMMVTPDKNRVYVKKETYGSYDPEPPRDAPIEVFALGPTTSNISLHKNLWVADYSQTYLIDGQPPFTNSKCYAISTYSGRFAGRCGLNINNMWSSGRYTRLRCQNENKGRDGDGYVPHVPQFPAGGTCGGCEAARNNTRTKGISANSEIGKIIWGLRTTHGMAMVMTTMLVIPLGTLTSRYYKETLMNMRFVNVHVWHGIHISTALTAFVGLFGGWLSAFIGRLFFGFARHPLGYVHWILGYISLLAFLLALFPSPFRAFKKKIRQMTIFAHFLVATVARVLWLLCLLTSFYVPGSPSGRNDIQVSGFTFEFNALIVVIWLIVDVVINVILMVFLKRTDKAVNTTRTYVMAVPIPLIRPHVQQDLPGAPRRKMLLAVHTSVCFLCALILTTLICWSSPERRYFGPMWYTHKDSGKLNMLMKGNYYD